MKTHNLGWLLVAVNLFFAVVNLSIAVYKPNAISVTSGLFSLLVAAWIFWSAKLYKREP